MKSENGGDQSEAKSRKGSQVKLELSKSLEHEVHLVRFFSGAEVWPGLLDNEASLRRVLTSSFSFARILTRTSAVPPQPSR